MSVRMDAACGSSIGKVRGNNEDNFYFNGTVLPQKNDGQMPPLCLYTDREGDECMAVFDGMGGGDYGEEASYAAAEQLKKILAQTRNPESVEVFLEDTVTQLNTAVCGAQETFGNRRMGTTMAALYFSGDGVYACNVGDSRIFGIRGDRIMQISLDHTDEAFMKQQGITGRKPRLSQYLGMDPMNVQLEPHIVKGVLQSGDVYLICSDGLTDMVEPEQIKNIIRDSGTASSCVQTLINAALDNGGKDNVTVIVCRILEQTDNRREENDSDAGTSPLAQLEDRAKSWGRKLWKRIRDSA